KGGPGAEIKLVYPSDVGLIVGSVAISSLLVLVGRRFGGRARISINRAAFFVVFAAVAITVPPLGFAALFSLSAWILALKLSVRFLFLVLLICLAALFVSLLVGRVLAIPEYIVLWPLGEASLSALYGWWLVSNRGARLLAQEADPA